MLSWGLTCEKKAQHNGNLYWLGTNLTILKITHSLVVGFVIRTDFVTIVVWIANMLVVTEGQVINGRKVVVLLRLSEINYRLEFSIRRMKR